MKFMILIQSNPRFEERWEALTEAQRARFATDHYALTDRLAESGELVVSEALADPALAARVRVDPAGTVLSDGPFAEVKEHLAGFYLVDVESRDRALAIAAQVPDAIWGLVEVRPVLDRSTWES